MSNPSLDDLLANVQGLWHSCASIGNEDVYARDVEVMDAVKELAEVVAKLLIHLGAKEEEE